MSDKTFSEAQKQYLAGFTMGSDVARAVRGLPILAGSGGEESNSTNVQVGGRTSSDNHNKLLDTVQQPAVPEQMAYAAQDRYLTEGKKLSSEEQAKRQKNPLDMWDEIIQRSERGQFPKGADLFLTKFHGLFFVAPAQNSFMCRLRIPGGELRDYQLSGLADLCDRSAGGTIDVTTRANLQIREIPADQAANVLYGLRELDIISLGSGGDNIRNVTASPLSGFDADELIETLPLARRMHHYITQHRELYGLPRKFNIAFDGGGRISALEDTNDIGFRAVRITAAMASPQAPEGIYFELTLGGITGHRDFARGTGVLLRENETLAVAGAIVRVFINHADRTDRKRSRLKYLLDDWGFEKFLERVEQELGTSLRRIENVNLRPSVVQDRLAHVDFHSQKQPDKFYVGVVLPVGRLTSNQARGLADIARQYGSGRLRLTVWQNVIIPDINQENCDRVRQALTRLGLDYSATSFRAGLVACTGNAGCKFAAANTKLHAMQIASYLEERLELDLPVNIHLTGCHHSCAQHYIGDIGLIATKVEIGEELVEGYDLYVGGGWGAQQGFARPVVSKLPFAEVPARLNAILSAYLEQREFSESFHEFIRRHSDEQLKALGCGHEAAIAVGKH